MRNLKCKIGFHNYENIGSQNAIGVVGGFSMTPVKRGVKKCKRCKKVCFVAYDISTNAHLDDSLEWKPRIILNQ